MINLCFYLIRLLKKMIKLVPFIIIINVPCEIRWATLSMSFSCDTVRFSWFVIALIKQEAVGFSTAVFW